MNFNYTPDGHTIARFMSSPAFVRGLQGPIGSGKSVACVAEMFRLALEQEKSIDLKTGERTGRRKVRSGVIRNTTPQLETTTMKSWLEWLPEHEFGPVRWRAPYRQDIYIPEIDLEWEVWFLALDRDEDVRKLLSFEFTNLWLNEARELSREIVTAGISRVKRYPRIMEGGPTRACVIMDTNAPHEEHWWAIMSGQADIPDWVSEEDRLTLVRPENWEFFLQPPAVLDRRGPSGELIGYDLNPDRENAKFTDETYYTGLIHGQSRDWIVNMLQNRIGKIHSGRAVYRDFNERIHVADQPFGPEPNEPIHVGLDFGLTPAACFAQDVRGQVRVFDELVTRDMPSSSFAPLLKKTCENKYPGFTFVFTGDPTGDNRNDKDATTNFQIFKRHGIEVQPAYTNEPHIRIGAVQTQINTLVDGGRPGYLVSPACAYVVAGKKGGYCYLKDREEIDKKSIYSHVADAEQYALLRMGYGKKLIGRGMSGAKPIRASSKQNLFDRKPTAKQANRASILSRGFRNR